MHISYGQMCMNGTISHAHLLIVFILIVLISHGTREALALPSITVFSASTHVLYVRNRQFRGSKY